MTESVKLSRNILPYLSFGRPVGRFLLLFCLTFTTFTTLAQQRPSRVDQLSDEQVLEFYRRAQASGLTELQIEQAAMSQGYTLDDITKMRRRMAQLRSQPGRSGATPDRDALGRPGQTISDTGVVRTLPDGLSRRQLTPYDSLMLSLRDTVKKPVVFGASLFENADLTFEPNLRIATPRGYVVGPDDEILIDIYGAAADNFRLKVSPEGTIKVPNLAPIFISGLTIEQAEQRIIARLRQGGYQGLGQRGSGTYATVSLGQIRSIRVTLVGEVRRPGTYTVPSVASAFNALYLAGGPNPETGSFRRISIIRGNRVVRTIDLYDFILRADQKDNLRLQDQDVIRVADYQTRVELAGEVRRPAIYEVLPGETLQTVLGFAGNFTDEAYTASITLRRNTPRERRIVTITQEQLAQFVPQRGDKYTIGKILDRYENRVQISGAVMRPGDYALEAGLSTVRELITRAEGLRKDAFRNRATIFREREDLDREVIAFDVGRVMQGQEDVPLRQQDSVVIQSIQDLREAYYVLIEGAVNRPDTFAFARNMSVADLITLAGGFQEGATANRVEVARRIRKDSLGGTDTSNTEIYRFQLDRELRLNSQDAQFALQPFDIVYVRTASYYEPQQVVYVEGEVAHTGNYAIMSRAERIADLIRRAGGLKPDAFLAGARFLRRSARPGQPGELVATDLRTILNNPGAENNLLLKDGDSLFIPRRSEVVRIEGAVLNPSAVSYERDFSFNDYINQAGGYTDNARSRKAYIIYPNGRKARTDVLLWAKTRPPVQPGSTIVVPFKPLDQNRLTPAERIGIISLIGTLSATAATLIINLSRP